MRKNTLGKGLDALIGPATETSGEIFSLPLVRLKPGGGQPRKNFDAPSLDELAKSIREKGVIQPLIVRKSGSGYEIVAGERRWRAAQKAGLEEIPVIAREMSGAESVEIALIENIQREDLNPIEQAAAYQKLTEEFGLTHEEISKRVGKSRAAITNVLRLLKLSGAGRAAVISGEISTGHARAMLGLKTPADREKFLRTVTSKGLSVRQAENLVKKLNRSASSDESEKPSAPERDIYLKRAERLMRERLGARVTVEGSRKRGRIIIRYSSPEELDSLSFEIADKPPI